MEHPLPPPLARQSSPQRAIGRLQLAWLTLRERMATNPSKRWRFTLRRHLLYRRERASVFRRLHTEALLSDFAAVLPEAVFLQIGANDGLTGDPIHALLADAGQRWRGVLVEPVAHLFAQLSERYGQNPALRLERAAVGEIDGFTVIHRLQTTATESLWLEQLASLDPDVLRQNAQQFGITEPEIISETVPSFTVATLLERHGLTRIDLVIIDTEGWDWRILRQFDLASCQTKLVLYEHQHLSPEENTQAHEFLARHGYDWAETPEGDTLAWECG